ncbi:hypothetical protein HK097_004332 [Rhizophlyctis rosea]|uniref:Uncharacterized protein n=1 Tax=Rhizophlyctis rosea TaxID=64517 RepID=A0AAD5SR61_9FUNG|nr:hypothetical protein HK097_004332 [Rhizophlyctis rosea]
MIARTLHYEQFRELRLEVDTTDVEGDPIISDEQWPILLHDSPSQILQPRRSPSAKRKDTPNKFQQFAQRDLIKLTDRVSAVLNLRNANSGDVPYSTADVKLAQRCVQRAGHAQEAMSASGVWEWLLAEQEEERARETDAMDVAQSAGVQPEERDNGQPQGNHESDDAVEDMEVDSNTPSALASAVNEGDSLQII